MRIFCFILILILAYIGPLWLLIPCAFIYAMSFKNSFELLAIALLIDAQFGTGGQWWGLTYTLGVGGIVCIAQMVKPYLRFHTTLG